MMTDPIADMLSRIRNALRRYHESVVVPYSRYKEQILRLFLANKFIAGLSIEGEGKDKMIKVLLIDEEMPVSPITDLQRLSRPSRRVYVQASDIRPIKSGRGILILSTDKGLMTDGKAKKLRLGGESICYIY